MTLRPESSAHLIQFSPTDFVSKWYTQMVRSFRKWPLIKYVNGDSHFGERPFDANFVISLVWFIYYSFHSSVCGGFVHSVQWRCVRRRKNNIRLFSGIWTGICISFNFQSLHEISMRRCLWHRGKSEVEKCAQVTVIGEGDTSYSTSIASQEKNDTNPKCVWSFWTLWDKRISRIKLND